MNRLKITCIDKSKATLIGSKPQPQSLNAEDIQKLLYIYMYLGDKLWNEIDITTIYTIQSMYGDV